MHGTPGTRFFGSAGRRATRCVSVAAVLSLGLGMCGVTAAASAVEPPLTHQTVSGAAAGETAAQSTPQLRAALESVAQSDAPREVRETDAGVEHIFTVPLGADREGEAGTVDVTVVMPNESRLGADSDRHGPYYLLNHFDQQVIANGAAAVVAASLCAIPAVGTIGCVAIQAALAAASAWISNNGLCPENLKGYFFNNGIRPSCVAY